MLSLQNISKQYGPKVLFEGFSLFIGERDRIAVVGSNGTGKSTLMKIVTGEVEADAGAIHKSSFTSVGYLPQELIGHAGRTLLEETLKAFEDLQQLQSRFDEISAEIERRTSDGESGPEIDSLLAEMGRVQHRIEDGEGWRIEARAKEILFGLGFAERDLQRPSGEFSSGWQMRIELARLLLREPSVLLLDEPTNHLDIESLEWLEAYLQSYAGAILLVSHDRRFLDNLVRRTVEISQGKGTEYSGTYSDYLRQKETRRGLLEAAYENQQKMIRETERFVERFRAKSTKARQVQSRIKRLEKIDIIELETDEQEIVFRFPSPPRSGRVVLQLEGVDKRYGDVPVLDGVSLTIERGDRIAVLGVNGAGKSTLARVLAGTEPIQGGRRTEGYQVIASYYAQNQADALNPAKTVLESVEEVAAFGAGTNLRTLLGHFLFSDDDVFKRVSVLSGGEKSRLALARMLLVPANFLILDEPTNHLDLRSKEVLKDALRNFDGTFAIVSHDRDFLAGLITKVLVAKDRGLSVYPGSVDDYLRIWHEKEAAGQTGNAVEGPEAGNRSGIQGERERKRREAERRQERYRRLKPLKDELEGLLDRIGKMERRKEELESMLADPRTYGDANQARSAGSEHREIAPALDALYQQWASVQEKIDAIEGEDPGVLEA
ncbi:MAG TPA: ATP-binding cassette domain-containing protein [Syntrophales bacterium]|nr:ATP-binding cassette domain-containing protein [Syntrophales bacterium]